jgi:hypothetical protein
VAVTHPNSVRQAVAAALRDLFGADPKLVVFDSGDTELFTIQFSGTPFASGLGQLRFGGLGTVVTPVNSGVASYGSFQTNGGVEIFRADADTGTFGDPSVNITNLTISVDVPVRVSSNVIWNLFP